MNKKLLILTACTSFITLVSFPQNMHAYQGFTPNPCHKNQNYVVVNADSVEQDAQDFIASLTDKGIGVITNQELTNGQRQKKFRSLLEKNFDMKTISRFALGRYWRTATKEQRKDYYTLFEDMIVDVYSNRFQEYDGQDIKISGARKTGKADALVSSVIVPKSGSDIPVEWRVRRKKNGAFKVIDIIVAGVSMSLTQRSDFSSVIQRGGGKVDVLLDHLRKQDTAKTAQKDL